MATTTDFTPVGPHLDTATLDRMVKTGLAMALVTVIVAMLVVLVAGLNASATLVVLFFAAVLGGLAGGRLAWSRRAS
jgi:hypothetical protein